MKALLVALACATLALTACSSDDEPDAAGSPSPSTSAPSTPSTTPSATVTPPVGCDELVDAVNADVAPLLAAGDFAATGNAPQVCEASNDRGDVLAVLALDLPDEGCRGRVERLPGLGRGSYACVGEQQGTQVLQATVIAAGATASLNALVELAPGPEVAYTDDDLAPIAAALARTLAGLAP